MTTTKPKKGEKPILFSGPMVKAIIEGRKTQTRRVLKLQPYDGGEARLNSRFDALLTSGPDYGCRNPYGKPGERLWVREWWAVNKYYDGRPGNGCGPVPEVAVECRELPDAVKVLPGLAHRSIGEERGRWRHARFMPRWASRLTLEIVSVRVERLQDISEEDAKAEGVTIIESVDHGKTNAVSAYRTLWNSINGADSWAKNPWVWMIEFTPSPNQGR